MISEGEIASAHGLFDRSSATAPLPALLSLRRSLMLLGSTLVAPFLARPEELAPEFESPPAAVLELTLEVSIVSPGFGGLSLPAISSSTHPAGVRGTGPNVEIGGGLLVGGDESRSVVRVILCDLSCGGRPGGGGGKGIPGSQLVVDESLERDEEGVLMAPVEAALREAGGLESADDASFSIWRGSMESV